MFRPGQVFKVKVELSPDKVGFGRATIVDCKPKHLVFQLKTGRAGKQSIPKGTRVWFVGNATDNRMNGLWSTVITEVRLHNGKHAFECKIPVFEPFRNMPEQRRRHKRAAIQFPVKLQGSEWQTLDKFVISRNISRSGIGLSILQECPDLFPPGTSISLILETTSANIELHGRVINTRYNWLSNRTEVGLEFAELSPESVESLDKILLWLGSKPRKQELAAQRAESGALAGWLRSTQENRKFFGSTGGASAQEQNTAASEEDEHLDDDDDFDDDGDEIEREDSDD